MCYTNILISFHTICHSGHLDAYPMALGNLGDLDEYMKISDCTEDAQNSSLTQTFGTSKPDSAALYVQAIKSSRAHYDDRHVYPYTFQGGYYHRHKMYKEAFHAWACAGDVIRQYVDLLIINVFFYI